MSTHGQRNNDAEYQRLLSEFPPRTIQGKSDLQRVEAEVGALLALAERTPAQDAFLDLLTTLIEAWENQNVSIPEIEGIDLLKVLCEERGLRQKDLVTIFGTESIVSEVFAGKRRLQTKHVTGLARFFHVSPAAFLPTGEHMSDQIREPETTLAAR